LNEQGRIYVGDPKVPDSYIIYGKPVYAVADGRVVAAVDGRKDSPPGSFPEGSLEDADGNHVVLELGDGSFALYAHLKPNSVKVSEGSRVRTGQVLGLVGTSGRSSEPHLHFQIADGRLSPPAAVPADLFRRLYARHVNRCVRQGDFGRTAHRDRAHPGPRHAFRRNAARLVDHRFPAMTPLPL